jgi:hypothetical protein
MGVVSRSHDVSIGNPEKYIFNQGGPHYPISLLHEAKGKKPLAQPLGMLLKGNTVP